VTLNHFLYIQTKLTHNSFSTDWLTDHLTHGVTVHFGLREKDGSRVSEWDVYSGRHPMSNRTWDTGFVEVINKGDKPGRCASRGKEMQIQWTYSFEVLHSKQPGVPVETRRCIVLFVKYIWFSTIWSLKWHYFAKSVQLTDINSCTVTAVPAPPNTYHVIFPEIGLLSTVQTSNLILIPPVYHYQNK